MRIAHRSGAYLSVTVTMTSPDPTDVVRVTVSPVSMPRARASSGVGTASVPAGPGFARVVHPRVDAAQVSATDQQQGVGVGRLLGQELVELREDGSGAEVDRVAGPFV